MSKGVSLMAASSRSRAVSKARRAHVFVAGTKCDLVDPALRRLAGFAKARAHARQVLQLQRDVLHDVGGIGAFLQSLQKAATHAGAALVLDQAGQQLR